MEPPPAELPVSFEGKENGCPAEFEVCLFAGTAKNLEHNLWWTRHYAQEAWIRCGVGDGGQP